MTASPVLPTEAEIERLMARFYTDIRNDPELGPIFFAAIGTSQEAWAKHEAKIAGFWRNALGLEKRGYQGSPMMTHAANASVMPSHFPIWIGLFERAADESLRPEAAATITGLAKRIGSSLAMGLASSRGMSGPPILRL